jgi:hypothetical protein
MLIVINILNIFCLSDSVTLLMLLSEFLVLAFVHGFVAFVRCRLRANYIVSCMTWPSCEFYCLMYDFTFL